MLMSAQLIRTTVQTRLHVQILKVVLAALVTLDTLEMALIAAVSYQSDQVHVSY